jgi:hypothetical protein
MPHASNKISLNFQFVQIFCSGVSREFLLEACGIYFAPSGEFLKINLVYFKVTKFVHIILTCNMLIISFEGSCVSRCFSKTRIIYSLLNPKTSSFYAHLQPRCFYSISANTIPGPSSPP